MIPLPRLGDYTDGIERINIELSLKNKIRLADEIGAFLTSPLLGPCGRPKATCGPPQEVIDAKVEEARALVFGVRHHGRTCSTASTSPSATCRTTRSCASWKRELKAPLGEVFCGLGVRAGDEARQRDPRARAAQPRVRRAAHARRRRQRAHQHAGQLRRLRDAAGSQRRGRAHHAARAQPRRRDLRRARHRHHQARVPDRRRAGAVRAVQGRKSTPKAASTAASCCAIPRCRRICPPRIRRASRSSGTRA